MPDPERDYPASETRNSGEMIPSGTVLTFPEINPRCLNCNFWTPVDGISLNGTCEIMDEVTNSDYLCAEYRREQR